MKKWKWKKDLSGKEEKPVWKIIDNENVRGYIYIYIY